MFNREIDLRHKSFIKLRVNLVLTITGCPLVMQSPLPKKHPTNTTPNHTNIPPQNARGRVLDLANNDLQYLFILPGLYICSSKMERGPRPVYV